MANKFFEVCRIILANGIIDIPFVKFIMFNYALYTMASIFCNLRLKDARVIPKEISAASEVEKLMEQNKKLLWLKDTIQKTIKSINRGENGENIVAEKDKEELSSGTTEESLSSERKDSSRSEGINLAQLGEGEGPSSSLEKKENDSVKEDYEFLNIVIQSLNDLDIKEFPNPSLLTDQRRNYFYDVILVMKRRMRRMADENEEQRKRLERLKKIISGSPFPSGRSAGGETKHLVDNMTQVDAIPDETRNRVTFLNEVAEKESLLVRKLAEIDRRDTELKKKEAEMDLKEANLLSRENKIERAELIFQGIKKVHDEKEEQLAKREKELVESKKRLKEKIAFEVQKFEKRMMDVINLKEEDEEVSDITELSMISDVHTDAVTDMTVVNTPEMNGPDQIIEALAVNTHERTGPVKLCVGDEGVSALAPVSIPTFFKRAAEKYEDSVALRFKEGGEWHDIKYGEYYRQVNLAAKAFIKLRLERFEAVCMFGFNAPEWFMGHLAAISAGGIATGIYITNGVDACEHIAEDANAHIFVVESSREVAVIKEVEERLNKKFEIIQYCGEPEYDDVYTWENLLEIGQKESDERLEERQSQIAINQCSVLVYTSGTTGLSKGVMLSHDNITWTVRSYAQHLGIGLGEPRLLSYLTPAHVAAMMVDLYGPMESGGVVYFAQRDVMKGPNLKLALQEVQPTFFFSIPRAWEKIFEVTSLQMNDANMFKKMVITLARSIGLKDSELRQIGKARRPFGYNIADKIIFQKIKEALGLQNCKHMFSGAGPIAPDIVEFFHSMGIILCETYGLSESCGPHTAGIPEAFRVGSCGPLMEGYHTKILDPDEDGNGEILMNGRHIAMGYLNLEEETKETLDSDGWLYTGDIGKTDSDNFLYITGRRKRLIIVAGGYNIAPEPIETKVKAKLPGVSFPVLIGDGKKFLSMILPMATEIDPETGIPLDTLAPITIQWCRGIGSQANTIQDILQGPDEKVMEAIQMAIDEVNNSAYNNQHEIKKWAILPGDFSIEGGELTPTMKVKMEAVLVKYEDVIDEIYNV